MLFEEMGYDLEDVSNVEIQIESCLNHVLTKITRSTRSTRNCMCNLWWGRDNDEQLPVLCGLLQQGFSLMVLHKYYRKEMIGAVFDVGRVSRFQCGLLHESFSLIVLRRCYKRRGFVQSLMRKRVSQIQCGFLHQDYFLFTLHKCYKRRRLGSQEKKGVGKKG